MASGGQYSDAFKKMREEVGEEEVERRIAVAQKSLQKMGLGSSRQKLIEQIGEGLEFKEQVKNKKKEQQRVAGRRLKGCAACPKPGQHRCTGCFLEFYCTKACQKAAWPGHKAVCKEVRAQFRPVELLPVEEEKALLENLKKELKGENYKAPGVPKTQFAVEVSVGKESGFMVVSNQDHGVYGQLVRSPGQEMVYDKLKRDVPEQGVKGVGGDYVAYYHTIYKGASEDGRQHLEINVEKPVAMKTDWY
jgi:hypothetical protein